MNDLEQL